MLFWSTPISNIYLKFLFEAKITNTPNAHCSRTPTRCSKRKRKIDSTSCCLGWFDTWRCIKVGIENKLALALLTFIGTCRWLLTESSCFLSAQIQCKYFPTQAAARYSCKHIPGKQRAVKFVKKLWPYFDTDLLWFFFTLRSFSERRSPVSCSFCHWNSEKASDKSAQAKAEINRINPQLTKCTTTKSMSAFSVNLLRHTQNRVLYSPILTKNS